MTAPKIPAFDKILLAVGVLMIFLAVCLLTDAVVVSFDRTVEPGVTPVKAWRALFVWVVICNAYLWYLNRRLDKVKRSIK